jgi:hypothetical protein
MSLSQYEREQAIELACRELRLTPERSLDKDAIEEAYKREVAKLDHLKLNAEDREENRAELTRSRDILILNQRQTRMAVNQQIAQEEAELNKFVTLQDNLGRQVVIEMPTAVDNKQLPPNGVVLLPRSQGPGQSAALDSILKTMSEQVLEQIADRMKLQTSFQLDMKGLRPCFSAAKKLEEEEQRLQIQKEFSAGMVKQLKIMQQKSADFEKASHTNAKSNQMSQEKSPESSIRSPFATTPKPPITT